MTGMLKATAMVIGVVILISIVMRVVHFVFALLNLIIPLLLVALIAYVFYRLITHKCVASSHRIFH